MYLERNRGSKRPLEYSVHDDPGRCPGWTGLTFYQQSDRRGKDEGLSVNHLSISKRRMNEVEGVFVSVMPDSNDLESSAKLIKSI